MAVDIFSHYTIKNGSLYFHYDVFKNDIYGLAVLTCELLLLQLDCADMISAEAFYSLTKVTTLDNIVDFLKVCQDKIHLHYTLLHIIE